MAFAQTEESKRHHYVPEFLMKPWASADGNLRAYHWDAFKQELRQARRGPKAFCFENGLLSLSTNPLGRDAIESTFFKLVDSAGAEVCRKLASGDIASLSVRERSDFVRLLLSLEARRPEMVQALRAGADEIAASMNSDPKILAAMAKFDLAQRPSDFLLSRVTGTLQDRMLTNIQELVNSGQVGTTILRAHWGLVPLGEDEGEFLLSDRPLVRFNGYSDLRAIWFCPLEPRVGFFAARDPQIHRELLHMAPQRFAKHANLHSLKQADRYVFAWTTRLESFIAARIPRKPTPVRGAAGPPRR